MKNSILVVSFSASLLLGSLCGSATAQTEAKAQMLRLRDGSILWGDIESHTESELQFHRLDTGGRVTLPWGFLDPNQEHELRLSYGYIASDFKEELIAADRIPLVDGTELVGVILGRGDGVIHVKNVQAVISLPVERIAGQPVHIQVPASDIYSREELYQQKLGEFDRGLDSDNGAEVAIANYDLALWCEAIQDYGRALQHYQAVPLADPSWPIAELRPALERTQRKALAQAEVDHLLEVDRLTRRSNFDRSFEMLAEFTKLFPQSPLMDDWNKQRERTEMAQLKSLRQEVAKRWHAAASKRAREGALLSTYGEALAYVSEGMSQEVLEAVTKDLSNIDKDINAEEVRVLFDEREGGRWRKASYGIGTWMLGEAKARAGIEEAPESTSGGGEQDAARKALEDKIKRYLDNQSAVRSSSSDDGESPEDFWVGYSVNSRINWLLAYYAEFSGDMDVRKAHFTNCKECGGSGAREVTNLGSARSGGSGGSTRLISCPTCHHIGIVRRISYR
ncbi:MAG: hypothetical protein OSB10_04105 [Planctomycetota bacterium]|nr:hypothetical protein [Planctomycetota bacterium]